MKPLQESLNDRLEQNRLRSGQQRQQLSGFLPLNLDHEHDLEVEDLLLVARRLRTASQLRARSHFVRQTERRMLRRSAELRLRGVGQKRASPRLRYVFGISGFVLLLLALLICFALLLAAVQISNPNNPLYTLKHLEQHLRVSLARSPGDQAVLNLQFARECLTTLSPLADPTHTSEYTQALADFDEQVQTTRVAINRLPMERQRLQLSGELATLQAEAIRTLRGFLPHLALPARLITTGELAFLGERVPVLLHGTLTFPSQTGKLVMIYLAGRNLPSRAFLLVDGQLFTVAGTLQNGQLVFALANWNESPHPHALGVLTPNGMAVQTTAVTIITAEDRGGSHATSSSDSNGNDASSAGQGSDDSSPLHR